MPRPILATVDIAALTHNLAVVRDRAPRSKVWAIVKANAYGHGLAHALSGLRDTDGFGLLEPQEAVKLRELGWAGPILLLEGFFDEADLELIDHYSLTTVVHCDEQMRMLERAHLSKPVSIYLKMTTGMNRLGYPPERFYTAFLRARACSNIGPIALMTHFSDAGNRGNRRNRCGCGIDRQISNFKRGAAGIVSIHCLANSAAVLWHPHTHADWVRPGIMLYGASPSGMASVIDDCGLMPAMSLTSEIIAVQNLQAGDTVGYSPSYRARAPMRIGTVACGYADGYPRHAPTGTPVMVDNVRSQLLGCVSMDMMAVDLTHLPTAGIGSPVELWGRRLRIDEVAQAAGTISYQLMCAIAPRVPMRSV